MLSDPDFDDNLGRTLESLNVTKGRFLSIADEDGELETITLAICALP
jgi:ubiquitin-like 1-activating enzyme E1 B